MKCFLLLTFVAFCSSYPYGYSRNFNVINQDGSVSMTTSDGRRVTLFRGLGQDNNDVVVVTEYEKFNRNPYYQVDTLDQQRLRELMQAEDDRLPLNYVPLTYNQRRNERYLENSLRDVLQREENSLEQDRRQEPQVLQQVQLLLQQQQLRRNQYPYSQKVGDEDSYVRFFRDQDVLRQQQDRDTSRQSVNDRLLQVIEGEREILDRQDQIQQQQLRQQRQQQRLLEQQQQQEQEQREQKVQQRYLQEVQEQVLRQQEQVLGEQQKVEQQQQRQLQQERNTGVRSLVDDAGLFVPSNVQQVRYWQQQRPDVYSLGELYRGYGQRTQRLPVVF